MKHRLWVCISVICIYLSLGGCASIAGNVQAAGDAGHIDQNLTDSILTSNQSIVQAVEQITPEQEYFIGRAVAADILSRYPLWTGSEQLTTYLNLICQAIVINSPRPFIFNDYQVAILDSQEINAFATSGGHIFITRGLIAIAPSEDALAAVIAHEVAHIQLRHSIRAIRSARVARAIRDTAAIFTGVALGGFEQASIDEMTSLFNEAVGDIVGTMVTSGYSQAQELDADHTALNLLVSAGYNPWGLVEILEELNKRQDPLPRSSINRRRVRQEDNSLHSGFSRTHPHPTTRLNNIERSMGRFRRGVDDTSAHRRARFNAIPR